jgi:hypothetical protein
MNIDEILRRFWGVILNLSFEEMFASTHLIGSILILTGTIPGASGPDRDMAGRFSFLPSIPAIIAASLLKFDISEMTEIGPVPFSWHPGILFGRHCGLEDNKGHAEKRKAALLFSLLYPSRHCGLSHYLDLPRLRKGRWEFDRRPVILLS